MKLILNKDKTGAEANGTHFQGEVNTTRQILLDTFGEPLFSDLYAEDKTTTEWVIIFPDDQVATIYDWKLNRQPDLNERYDWHIGGKNELAVKRVQLILAGEVGFEVDNHMEG